MSYPALPAHIKPVLEEDEIQDLWNKMIQELLNADWNGRTHHNRRTYDAGCKGPLCAKAQREHGRRRMSVSPSERYRFIDSVLDFWKPIAEERIEIARQQMLVELTG